MEKPKPKMTFYPQQEVKVYVKSKNRSPTLIKDKKKNLNVEKKRNKVTIPPQNISAKKVERPLQATSLLGKVKKHEWKKPLVPFKVLQQKGTSWRTSMNNPFSRKKELKSNYLQFTFSIFGAVVIGAIMGLSILSIFFSDHMSRSNYSIDSHLPQDKSIQTSLVSMPSLHTVMLQAGSFLERERAQKAIDDFKSKGIIAVMSNTPPFRVFVGMALNDTEAKKMAGLYKKEFVEVYQKELDFTYDLPLTKDQHKLKSLIQKSHALVTVLSEQSIKSIVAGSNLSKDNEVTKLYQEFNNEYQTVLTFFPQQAQVILTKMHNAIGGAMEEVRSSENKAAARWKIQEELVRYVTLYEDLVRFFRKSS